MTMAEKGTRPIVAPPEWQSAVDAADGQCEHSAKSGRCSRTLSGGYRLYLDTDGRVYCSDHHARKTPAPYIVMSESTHQDSLF